MKKKLIIAIIAILAVIGIAGMVVLFLALAANPMKKLGK